MLHHACVPTHPEPTSQDTLQISIRKLSSHTPLFWTLPEQLGTDYTTHVCQPWTNVAKTHHKTSDPKIFHLTHPCIEFCRNSSPCCTTHVCQTHPEDTPQNLRPEDFHLTHPCFELCRSSSPYYTTHVCQPWTNVPKDTPQNLRQTLRCLSHIFCFELCRNSSPCLHHACGPNPSWTNVTRHTTNFNPKIFHLTHPCFELCLNNSEQMTPRMCANPFWTNVPKLRPQDFYLTSLFWTLPEQLSMLHHACEPTHPVPTSQDTT